MSIGTKIYELRTARNLSQGDLADLLDVSRQSVSKWETDASVPDLDKLCRLCDVFGVTLDELTCRAENGGNTQPVVTAVEESLPTTHQRIIGYILLAVSLIAGIVIWIFAENKEELIPVIAVVLTCSLICLFVKQNAGYWCVWTVASLIIIPLSYIERVLASVIFPVIMALVARKCFAGVTVATGRKKSIFIILGWIALIGLRLNLFAYALSLPGYMSIALVRYIAMELNLYIVTTFLLTYTVCYIISRKRSKG